MEVEGIVYGVFVLPIETLFASACEHWDFDINDDSFKLIKKTNSHATPKGKHHDGIALANDNKSTNIASCTFISTATKYPTNTFAKLSKSYKM